TTEGLQFQPEKNITRGEFALMVTRWKGLNPDDYAGVELPFADLASIPSWMLGGMKATYSLGILKGSLEGGQGIALGLDAAQDGHGLGPADGLGGPAHQLSAL
ncbi:S-layer homology domain-containing protein, partial [Intestinimonas massiliensis]|uniref:S-layer homology domain-containing protein n=1 Tax=Intestinimonas massiliensis (ex Afouda et al. 2020) TaxID=1673721 RepID=UPI00210CB660